jgi:hypothetical protein
VHRLMIGADARAEGTAGSHPKYSRYSSAAGGASGNVSSVGSTAAAVDLRV